MAQFVVTIDGPAASGKSTMARLLAEKLGVVFLDTGAMYRAVTWAAMRDGVDFSDAEQLAPVIGAHVFTFEPTPGAMKALVDGTDITNQIRDPELTANVRHVASSSTMRAQLVEMQRRFATHHGRVVTEGRDQGTVAFPEADVKFYLLADAAERARRRQAELEAAGAEVDFEQLKKVIEARDKSDQSRAVGPLKPATDAILIDTTKLSIGEVIEHMRRHIEERCPKRY